MTESKHTPWVRHLDTIGEELLHLTIACDVRLRDPGVFERVLKNDETVCGVRNPIGFRKLHNLVAALVSSVNKAADRIGPEETRLIVETVTARLDRLRELGGTTGGGRPATSDEQDG
jgi:hypothetical protein